MEFSSKWDVNMVMNELIQGMDQAGQLKLHLGSSSSASSSFQVQDLFLQRIISSFQKALLILQCTDLATQSLPEVPLDSGAVESSLSMNNGGTPTPTTSDNSKQVFMDNQNSSSSKKRKTIQTWTEQVKVSAEHGLEGPADDGYSWRKYGQKDILGAKFPRSYYRCTYRAIRNCCATKQVQRSDQHPTVFDVTYRGFHTCSQSTNPPLLPPQENIDQPKQTNVNINHQITGLLMNFQSNTLESNYRNNEDAAAFSFSCPSSSWTWAAVGENQFEQISTLTDECLLGKNSGHSPTMLPESNYYSASSWNDSLRTETTFLQQYECELTNIISSDHASADFDLKFLCNISDFLS